MPTSLHITGYTQAFRRDLKAIGGRWNPDLQAWLLPMSRRKQAHQLARIAPIQIALYDTGSHRVIRPLHPWTR
jgi:hypothetical protein